MTIKTALAMINMVCIVLLFIYLYNVRLFMLSKFHLFSVLFLLVHTVFYRLIITRNLTLLYMYIHIMCSLKYLYVE